MFEIAVLTSKMREILFHDHKHIRRVDPGSFVENNLRVKHH